MSASREKKSRQGQAEVINEKQLKAQQEAAQAKRNTIIYTVIGVVCAVAVAALLIWNSGLIQDREDAVIVAGEGYSVTDVQYHYNNVLNQYYMYAQYGMDVGFDPTQNPAEQMYDEEKNITWRDQLMDEAVKALAQTKVLAAQAKAEGFELSEDGKHEIEHAMSDLVSASARNNFATVNSYLKALFGRGMNKSAYKAAMTESQLAYEFQVAYGDELVYTDEQLETYYTENKDDMDLFDYNFAVFEPAEDETKDAETLVKEAKAKAEAVLAKVQSGVAFMEAAGEGEADHAEGEEHVHTPAYEERAVSGSYLDPNYADWLKSADRVAEDATLVEDEENGIFYVVEFVGRSRDEEVAGDVRHILVAADQDEGATAPSEEQYAAAKTKAEELLNQWKAGAADEESFAALATANTADPGSAANGGLYENVSSQSGFIPEFAAWATDPARKPGDTGLVQNTGSSTKGWHIMYFVGQNEPVWKDTARTAKATEDVTAWIDGLVEAAEVTRTDALQNVR